MNVRIASATTIRSGVITSRTDTARGRGGCRASRRAWRRARWTSSSTSSSGSRRSRNARANGRAAASSCVSRPTSFPSHQRAASGNDSSRSVSPVGAQSTTITSQRPSSTWRLIRSRLNSSSPPGGTVSSSAAIRSTPRSTSSRRATPARRTSGARARPARTPAAPTARSPTSPGSRADLRSRARRPSEWAGSVESTIVRCPAAAQRRAVAAATDVLPTPPLPV